MSINIHPTAIVSPKASLAEGVSVGPYSIIGDNVSIGADTNIGPHVVIEGYTKIGKGNRFFQFCSIGSTPQDLKYRGESSELQIGDNNTVREYVTLQPGTETGSMISKIGSGNLFMVGSHVGHDAVVGNGNVFANYCCLAGHVTIEDKVTIGGLSGIHQFVRIGQLAILGAGAMVAQDIPPFCIAQGDHAKLMGINKIGVSRGGYTSQEITQLRRIFRQLFWNKKSGQDLETARGSESDSSMQMGLRNKIKFLEEQAVDFAAAKVLVEFLKAESKRGVAAANRRSASNEEN